MRRLAWMAVSVLLLSGAGMFAQLKHPMPADVGAGRVAWFDIATTDVAKAKEFYGKLFGWTFSDVAGGGQAVEVNSRGAAIGTIRRADGAISKFNGVVYIQVDDVRQATARAQELGAEVAPGFPFNLPNGTGAISLIADPSGHPLGMYSRTVIPGNTP